MTLTENMLCAKTHEYVAEVEKGTYQIGLTNYAVEQLGDIVFIELPEVGAKFGKGEVFATVESVKAASEIYMPVSGKVIEINETDKKFDKAKLANLALEQIEHKEYYQDHLDYSSVLKIYCFGICFCKKSCSVAFKEIKK